MTNDKWHTLSVLDPFVRATAKTPLSEYLKTKKKSDDTIAKVFVSGADGFKVDTTLRRNTGRIRACPNTKYDDRGDLDWHCQGG